MGERNKEFLWKGEILFKNIDIITIENKFRGPEIISPLDKKISILFHSRSKENLKIKSNLNF